MTERTQVFAHDKQKEFLKAQHHEVSVLLAGRGWGKTAVIAIRMYQRVVQMPRGHFFFASSSFDQIDKRIMPTIKGIWTNFGLLEGVHYVIDKKPPKGYAKPLIKPDDYKHTISFINGAWFDVISLQRYQLARSASFDGGDIDEAGLVPWEVFSEVFSPAVRGNRHRFKKAPLHGNIGLYTSIPRTPKGFWIFDFEEKAKAAPRQFFWMEGSARDNVKILGEEWFDKQKAQLSESDYDIEIENRRNLKIKDGFYHSFDRLKQGYLIDQHGHIITTHEPELEHDHAINLTFDFGGNFSCCLAFQTHGLEERIIKQFHVKFDRKIKALIKDVCDHFAGHNHKHFLIYGEPRGMDNREDNAPLFVQVQQLAASFGWTSTIMVERGSQALWHKERYTFINKLFEENTPFFPIVRFNREQCRDAIIAIERTRLKENFTKDKSEEKRPKRYKQEHAPHYTDAFDNAMVQKWHHLALQLNNQGRTAGKYGTI